MSRRSFADDRLAKRAVVALRIAAAEDTRAAKATAPAEAKTTKATYCVRDRVIVTHNTRSGARAFTGEVVNAWPAGGGATYAIRPDGASRRCPNDQATANEMSLLDEGGAR